MKKKIYGILFIVLFTAGFLSFDMTGECIEIVNGYENYDVKVSGNYQYLYIPETDSIQIVGYTGQEDVVVVPEQIDGKPVTIVYNFNDCFNKYIQVREWPKEVYIPDGVIEIGYFGSCKKLEKIHMPDSVQYIRPYAFDGCVNLKEIVLPSGLKEIGNSAFAGCIKIKKVMIPYGVKEIGECAFASCNALREVSIPDSVTKIGVEAFSCCVKLSKVKLSDNLKVLTESIFYGCNIKSIRLPKNLTKIDYEALSANPLTKITIPSKVTKIEGEAFSGCPKLKKITIKSKKIKKIGKRAFKYIHKKAVFDVPNKSINKYRKLLTARTGFDAGKMKIK